MTSVPEANQVKEAHEESLLAKPNVVGVGVGLKETNGRLLDEIAVKVLVTQKLPRAGLSARAIVPEQVNGVETDVMQVGVIRALQERTDRWRPAPGGVSIGHYQITAGTLGCVVRDRSTGDRLILSNNHVLANSNDAQLGDPILQPGPYDGGSPTNDIIGHLARFCPIEFEVQPGTCNLAGLYAGLGNLLAKLSGSTHRLQVFQANPQAENQVDAAVAKPTDDDQISDEILDIGELNGIVQGTLGMGVRKSGRTTGFTTGTILVINATVSVTYGAGRTARFVNQFVSGPMSQGGDSGSLVVAGDQPLAVGLLFAGSDQSTIFSPIQAVLDCLDVDIPAGAVGAASNPGVSMDRVQRVKDTHEAELMSKANVVGVGVGYREKGGRKTDDLSLVVMVERKVPETQLSPQDIVPKSIEGVPVDVQEVGQIRAQPLGG
jgi:hypothetical protein